jgi:monovalent cation:H+ antiporter, CPA1 family
LNIFLSMEHFSIITAAFFVLLAIASFTVQISEKWKIPHSVFLVTIGVFLTILSLFFPIFSFLGAFELSPQLIFYVFLPTIIFESSFRFPLRKIIEDIVPISILAIGSYLLSVFFISLVLFFLFPLFGIEIPFLLLLLFSSIISATDPVAVLAVFRKLGVTPRLARLFEGESLFNDGTALAMFIIVADIIHRSGTFYAGDFFISAIQFLFMVLGGVAFGILMGMIFIYLIEYFRKNDTVELTLTLIMAHMTFLLADLSKHLLHFGEINFEISAVIATVIASIILGNKGVQKFSPNVRRHMYAFWEHLSFAANSLIFLLIGMMAVHVFTIPNVHLLFFPILFIIAIVIVGRYISIRIPLSIYNLFHTKDSYFYIPKMWQEILAWASLRGAIAIASLLLLPVVFPDGLSVEGWNLPISETDFLMTAVISCIFFTLFFKALSLEFFTKKLRLSEFSETEKVAELESKVLLYISILDRIEILCEKQYISKENSKRLQKIYKKEHRKSLSLLATLVSQIPEDKMERIFRLHALSIEEKILQKLLDVGEISEKIFWKIHEKLLRQSDRIERNEEQIQGNPADLKKIQLKDVPVRYQISRARIILTAKVIKRFEELKEANVSMPSNVIDIVIQQYRRWNTESVEQQDFLLAKYSDCIKKQEFIILSQFLDTLEKNLVSDLHEKSILEERVFDHMYKSSGHQ